MIIGRSYCVNMARYNAWQNKQLYDFVDVLDQADLTKDRGAFFGSILGTLSHLVWGDQMWMSRFDGGGGPKVPGAQSHQLFQTGTDWRAARVVEDARIRAWAEGLTDEDLQQDMTWFSGVLGQDVTKPVGGLIVHMFNHQTHHRGQVHAMLTQAGSQAPVSDLFMLPDDI